MLFVTNETKEIEITPNDVLWSGKSYEFLFKKEQEYRKDLIVGEPRRSEKYTVQQLKNMGIIGLYRST